MVFKTAEKTELNQISLTGMRAIVLIGLLIVKPRSLDEIRKAFISLGIMEQENSDDILRIDLNTIKVMGCEISRASQKTDYKYVLTKHPFTFKMQEDEVKVLKKVYNKVKESADISLLLDFDDFFKKVASFMDNQEIIEALAGVSILKYYNIDLIKDLMVDCKYKNKLELTYKKSTSQTESLKEIIPQEVVFKNDKVYVYAYDLNKQESIVLNLKRIKSIESRKPSDTAFAPKYRTVRFLYKDLKKEGLNKDEKVLETLENGQIVEGTYHNDFVATQRVLSMGAKCVVLEPVEFRNSVVEKIKEMRKIYER